MFTFFRKEQKTLTKRGGESNPEGWYSVNIFEAAHELRCNTKGQQMLMDSLFQKTGIRFETESLIERDEEGYGYDE